MSFTRRCVAWTGMGLALALVTGCQFIPQLSVTPLTIALGGSVTSASFRIENAGGGTLNYTVSEDLPWIEIALGSDGKQSGVVEGSVTNEVAFIQVLLNRAALPAQGVVRGEIKVASNAGDQTVIVSATQSGEPVLQVSRTAIDFGLTGQTEQFTITNGGNARLEWTLAVPATATWLNAQPRSGVLESFGRQAVVTVDVSRTGISAQADPYTAALSIVSNGGNAAVNVSMGVPAFTVQPGKVDFGRTEGVKSQSLTVENNGTLPVALSISAITDSGGNWLSVDNPSATLPASGTLQVIATANGTGLAPGNYTASIKVEAPALAYSQLVPVTLSVPGFTVAPATLAFGTIGDPATLPLTLTNLGAAPIQWTAAISANSPWVSMSATSGTLSTTQTINVTATPGTVDPGQYASQITFTFDGGQDTVAVTMSRPKPAALKVAPQDMDFGVTRTETTVGIWNDGLGTINWSIDTAGFPAWLSISPVNGAGIASGTVSGDITDTVTVSVNRSLAPPDLTSFDFTFNVTASGDSTTAVPVRVRASAPQLPEFSVVGEGVDGLGVPYVRLDIAEDTQDFFVVNTGDGVLNWNIVPGTEIPSWIISISPQQGTVDPGRQQTVRVTVDRTGLSRAGATFQLPLESNDPSRRNLIMEIQIRVPYSIIIEARPKKIVFGRYANTALLSIANFGDAGEYLYFKVTSSQPDWLFVEPPNGRSIGTSSQEVKDWQTISLAIDRSRITGQGGVAKLIIEAVDVPEDALPVEPFEVEVSVDLAKLTIETGRMQLRPPSLIRMNVLLRDQAYRAYPSLEDNFTDTRNVYDVPNVLATFLEDAQPIDPDETTVLVKKNENLRFNVLVMLDFSGSMRAAAQAIADDGQFGGPLPAGVDPLNELYVRTIPAMLAEFPAHYRVALAVFNERRFGLESAIRIITSVDPADPAQAQYFGSFFTTDKDVLAYRINHLDVQDNGATALQPAVDAGRATLAGIDSSSNLIPFDTAEESILIAVTDGRRTTPPTGLADTVDRLSASHVRFFPIGWGNTVQANTLITLSSGSGGHYYSPQTKKNTEGVDLPQLSELLNWCRTEPGNATAQSLPRDLRSHVSISYPSLNEAESITLEARVEVLDTTPSVSAGVAIGQVPMLLYANDVKLGQIGMRTEGITNPGGTTSVFVYMDYAPRNLGRLTLQLSAESIGGLDPISYEVVTTPEEDGGLVSDWVRTDSGTQVSFAATAGRVFRYGDYGELVEVRVTGAVNPFKVRLAVVDPVIGFDIDGKYFSYPDTITVADAAEKYNQPFRAPSLPRLALKSVVPDLGFIHTSIDGSIELVPILDLPADKAGYTVEVFNLGGAHSPTDVMLYWLPSSDTLTIPGTQPGKFKIIPDTDYLSVDSTEKPGRISIGIDPAENDPPGAYSGTLYVSYLYGAPDGYGTMSIQGKDGPYFLRYFVNNFPTLAVAPETLDFEDYVPEIMLMIRNTGVGNLEWSIDVSALPSWLTVQLPEPTTPPTPLVLRSNGWTEIAVSVNRGMLAPGNYSANFTVVGDNGDSRVVTVQMSI